MPECAASHLKFLDLFLSSGFKSLKKIDDLKDDLEKVGRDALLPGLGADKAKKLLAACVAETSLLSAIYWICCSYALLGHEVDSERRQRILTFIASCRGASGAFAPHPAQQEELLSTVSAVQLAVLLGEPELLEVSKVAAYIRSLQLPDGSFTPFRGAGESQGDCRFTFAALCAMTLLKQLGGSDAEHPDDSELCDAHAATADWLLQCQNLDGGFGCRPRECESHAGHTFCCLAALSLLGRLDGLSHRGRGRLLRWLAARQTPQGGMNGRPGKKPDVCYTWWTLAAAQLAESLVDSRLSDIFDLNALQKFVHLCMADQGGIGPHPEDDPDPFHTFFGLAGLSLCAGDHGVLALERMEPTLVLPVGLLKGSAKVS